MTIFKITLAAGVALGALALAAAPALAQAKTYTIKFNHVLGPKEPYHDGFLAWAKRVASAPMAG